MCCFFARLKRNWQLSFFSFQSISMHMRLSRADSIEIGVCDRDRPRVENRPPSEAREIRSRRFESQRNNSDTCAVRNIFSLATLTHCNIIARARTKHHLSQKNAARRHRRFRARGRLARRTHRTRDRRARRRRVGRRDDDGVGAAHQRASVRSARA